MTKQIVIHFFEFYFIFVLYDIFKAFIVSYLTMKDFELNSR